LTAPQLTNWQDVQSEVLNRISSRQWKPGQLIPNEVALAKEFGCARTTVNRALRTIAESGLLDRKRKAGTRVAKNPIRKAVLNIPIIRQEIEDQGQAYSHTLISSKLKQPPADIRARMKLVANAKALHLITLHMSNQHPYVCEDRWINTAAVKDINSVDFTTTNANEWLVANAPFTHADISFSALQADCELVEQLGAKHNDALFVIERTTWQHETSITSVRLTFHSGYRMQTTI